MSNMTSIPIENLASEWLRLDKDEITRKEIQSLLDSRNHEELEKRLRNRIAFGTAGLRARMEAGFSRMNSLTVIQATQGFAEYLIAQIPDVRYRGVVIGFDARHNSKNFAKLAAAAFVAKKIKVWWLEVPVHTPLVPFGVHELRAAAGVMITASHNPPRDNGYKVYWQNACQIIPPHDTGIAQSIMNNLEPASWDSSVVDNCLLVEGALGLVLEKYYTAVKTAADPREQLLQPTTSHVDFTYTAMHGVGLRYMLEALEKVGLRNSIKIVNEQAHPDPDFPGLPFPNPEEHGALEVAKWSADRNNTDIVIATDPDADRLAVAEKVDGKWYQFTGNQLGILIAAHVLASYSGSRKKLAMVASTVSSKFLAHFAEKEGFHYAETLTGFKWIGNKALDLDQAGYDTRYGFEESIGYMIPGVVKDKDGVAAAATFLAATIQWKKEHNLLPYAKLQKLYHKFGYFEEANTYFTSPDPGTTKRAFDNIRGLGQPFPKSLGHRKIHHWRDLTLGWDSRTLDHKPELPVDNTSQMITCELEGDVRMTMRASGTEPKIKVYIEGHNSHQDRARKAANEVLNDVTKFWLRPEEYGLRPAA